MDMEQERKKNEDNSTARAEKEINDFFYSEERRKDDNLNELVNTGLSSIYMDKPEEKK
ncbi:hypothetical protein [Fictibacillus barbaricus]|uniref:Uncharacterized protein n=1 Tax=Fictibacillus barbaricus TaxID=182136 RepID=A0ABU1U531_9BACL|nr:hypothetical protein [Fictibacillus barbaricus]MDR7074599.1 hypothetical protein [Fictibacillus barbaricus]